MKITREYLIDRGVCYSDAQIAELVPPEGLTTLQVCDADSAPPKLADVRAALEVDS